MLQALDLTAVRGLRLAGLATAVLVVHLWLANSALPDALGLGAGEQGLARMEVAFVRELAPAAPAALAQPAARTPAPRMAAPPAQPASAPAVAKPAGVELAAVPLPIPVPEPVPEPMPALPLPSERDVALAAPPPPEALAAITAAAAAGSSAAAAGVNAAATAVAVEWPPSTRLSYRLSGFYRGPVEGQARVEWLRNGAQYQVHMDLGIGPSFAPLLSRRVTSEGDITPQGLFPRRFEEVTRALFRDPRRVSIALDDKAVRLPSGAELPRPLGVQDSASQFVQLTWLFTTQPERLQAGQAVEFPLALPRQLQVWTYDVLATEQLETPAGTVQAVHVKPRREARPGGDLTAEVWFAPSLQYLPVRILIRQDAENFIDLVIERLPQQAQAGR